MRIETNIYTDKEKYWTGTSASDWNRMGTFQEGVNFYVKVLTHPCPPDMTLQLLGAFKWGTLWTFI